MSQRSPSSIYQLKEFKLTCPGVTLSIRLRMHKHGFFSRVGSSLVIQEQTMALKDLRFKFLVIFVKEKCLSERIYWTSGGAIFGLGESTTSKSKDSGLRRGSSVYGTLATTEALIESIPGSTYQHV